MEQGPIEEPPSKTTGEEPMRLVKPYIYRRYFERLNSEIQEDICHDEE